MLTHGSRPRPWSWVLPEADSVPNTIQTLCKASWLCVNYCLIRASPTFQFTGLKRNSSGKGSKGHCSCVLWASCVMPWAWVLSYLLPQELKSQNPSTVPTRKNLCFLRRVKFLDLKLSKGEKHPSLVAQWWGLCAINAGAQVPPLVGELRSHMPHGMSNR